jgi:hypothetical protein
LSLIVLVGREQGHQKREGEEKCLDWILGAKTLEADNLAAKLSGELKTQGHLAAFRERGTTTNWNCDKDVFFWVKDNAP